MIAIMASVLVWGIRQYGDARVSDYGSERLEKVLSGAVVERKESLRVDTAQTNERAAATQAVRSAVISHREKSKEVISHYETNPDCRVGDAERLRVFLSAASAANRVVDSTTGLP